MKLIEMSDSDNNSDLTNWEYHPNVNSLDAATKEEFKMFSHIQENVHQEIRGFESRMLTIRRDYSNRMTSFSRLLKSMAMKQNSQSFQRK